MTQLSWPWGGDVTGDASLAPYSDDEWTDIWRKLFQRDRTTEGVLKNYGSDLVVTNPSGDTIRVGDGAAIVDGKFYENTAAVDTVVSSNGSYRVVLQKDWTAQTVRIAILSGLTPTQSDGTIWEIKLAEVVRSGTHTITDTRTYTHFATEVSSAMLADLAVTTAKMALDSVDDTIVGDRVPQFYRRQGGDASNWKSPGTTNYTPAKVRMQGGSIDITIGIGSISASVSITFPVAFSNEPIVIVGVQAIPSGGTGVEIATAAAHVITGTTGCTIWATRTNPESISASQVVNVGWLAFGPE